MKSGKISTLALIIVLAAGIMTACNASKPYPAAKDITVIIPKGAGGEPIFLPEALCNIWENI